LNNEQTEREREGENRKCNQDQCEKENKIKIIWDFWKNIVAASSGMRVFGLTFTILAGNNANKCDKLHRIATFATFLR